MIWSTSPWRAAVLRVLQRGGGVGGCVLSLLPLAAVLVSCVVPNDTAQRVPLFHTHTRLEGDNQHNLPPCTKYTHLCNCPIPPWLSLVIKNPTQSNSFKDFKFFYFQFFRTLTLPRSGTDTCYGLPPPRLLIFFRACAPSFFDTCLRLVFMLLPTPTRSTFQHPC